MKETRKYAFYVKIDEARHSNHIIEHNNNLLTSLNSSANLERNDKYLGENIRTG